ncbi:hypothetical protein BOTCAL_0187g00060 [Botryotinia calthae]|uniref:Uncharacterized protein n=1 Tax=Botryotinia calthae TaxID=38488 RepID=A0A4Y8D2J4_9HELO|nr:hypothetical protein BOTCAL_0187g00060 [Botryotinia calthae]
MRLIRPSILLKLARQPFQRPVMAFTTRIPHIHRTYFAGKGPDASKTAIAKDLIPKTTICCEEPVKMVSQIEKELNEKRLLTEQVNMLELIRLRSMYFRMVKEKGTALRKNQSQLDTMEMERRQSFKVFLPDSIRQADKFPQLQIIFDATFGISKDDLKPLLEMDERCDGAFKVQDTVESHGMVFSRLMPDMFPPLFKQWLETIREVKSQIDNAEAAFEGNVAAGENDALTALDLISRVNIRLHQRATILAGACELTCFDDFETFGRSTYPLWEYKDRMIKEWEERKLMPKLMAAADANEKIYWRYL